MCSRSNGSRSVAGVALVLFLLGPGHRVNASTILEFFLGPKIGIDTNTILAKSVDSPTAVSTTDFSIEIRLTYILTH
ncbi:hypothetical protein GWI33_001372 [Rhynchophorus ferrugineus]|uniref:Uncharacterized protein n=1 Tax=Rhynchophorus ferrugineus TaxID=354439 RepID=A0A834ISN6_RHYFE|nr:hypothetical protein GWI33_001372 [Rhynchophorus ferrugineus]